MLHEISINYWERPDIDGRPEAMIWDVSDSFNGVCIIFYPKTDRWFESYIGRYVSTQEIIDLLTNGEY